MLTEPLSGGPAPALSVRGTGLDQMTIAGLTAGGCALLVFVSEECPTSAMALRRLGPLCQAWAEAGLAAVAVFEDPLEVAVRVSRRLGWAGQVVAEDPPVETSRAYGLVSVPTAVLIDGDGRIAGRVTGWDQPALAGLIEAASSVPTALDIAATSSGSMAAFEEHPGLCNGSPAGGPASRVPSSAEAASMRPARAG